MADPWAALAALDAREQTLIAELAVVRAERLRLIAEVRRSTVTAAADERPLFAAEVVDRWRESGIPGCPASAEALLHRMRRTKAGDRWHELKKIGERHQQGRALRWPWREVAAALTGREEH